MSISEILLRSSRPSGCAGRTLPKTSRAGGIHRSTDPVFRVPINISEILLQKYSAYKSRAEKKRVGKGKQKGVENGARLFIFWETLGPPSQARLSERTPFVKLLATNPRRLGRNPTGPIVRGTG